MKSGEDMVETHTFALLPRVSDYCCPYVQVEQSLPSEIAAIPSFVDQFVLFIEKYGCPSGNESDIEIALREALGNAVTHGNHEDTRKHVYVSCRCDTDREVSIVVRDESQGFTRGHIALSQGCGIYLMSALMDSVHFEQGGAVVHMWKKSAKIKPVLSNEL
jgi:serine/threonine-protein kinase RsbW